ncbi:hypothetical protein QE152_g11240 [Popillia japonica]|uniref:Uncharacterized protein n=1 Tax=Popillia japonica TaxID=7064 RepID=A0AAW1LR89_POPJA
MTFLLHNSNNIPDRLQSIIQVNRAILPEKDKGNDADGDDIRRHEIVEKERYLTGSREDEMTKDEEEAKMTSEICAQDKSELSVSVCALLGC